MCNWLDLFDKLFLKLNDWLIVLECPSKCIGNDFFWYFVCASFNHSDAAFDTGDNVPVVAFPKLDQFSYAASPCELMSRPSRSASSLTRRPTVYFTIRNASSATTLDSTTVISTPCAWIHTCAAMS